MDPPAKPAFALLAALLVAGACGRAPAPPVIAPGDGHLEWRGTMPCADCTAIAVRLVLERDGGRQRYLLEETYLAGDGGQRFVDSGRWSQDEALLRLEGRDGSRRSFALQADGSLQSRDSHGRALPVQDDAVLSPLPP
ncbi:MAG TPA: copper resistance protein NlpE N-terminal domain-containing protein [Luteimonas sp.]|nr:copper resistance protein NlpE N-terminal domain-containing protein [Luteimonas sp.]